MKLLFLGDTHGNIGWMSHVILAAKKHEIDWIVQLGDFGYWEHKQHGVDFLFEVQKYLEDNDLNLVWLDGNHENHPVLRANYSPGSRRFFGHPDYGFWRIRPNIWHTPRGHRWAFDGVTFMSLGGAYSIDKNYRKVGRSWWPEELITRDEADLAIAGGLVDVLLTHDCPDGVQGAIPAEGGLDRQKDRWPESLANRRVLAQVVKAVQPHLLVHGHYHHRNTEIFRFQVGRVWHSTLIEGLACDEMNGAALILTTEEMEMTRA